MLNGRQLLVYVVVAVLTEPGQLVNQGNTLVLLEAMKMELPLCVPRDSTVETVVYSAGELVAPGVSLGHAEPATPSRQPPDAIGRSVRVRRPRPGGS